MIQVMARALRIDYPETLYHVLSRENIEGSKILQSRSHRSKQRPLDHLIITSSLEHAWLTKIFLHPLLKIPFFSIIL